MYARRQILLIATGLMLALSACTVQPLHSSRTSIVDGSSNVFIEPVNSRIAQVTRNKLIFLLNGGSSQPADAAYNIKISVVSQTAGVLSVATGNDSDTTASRVTTSGVLTITNTTDEKDVKTFKRSTTALFDRSSQLFANDRAKIDAENRAAEELAEQFRVLILTATRN